VRHRYIPEIGRSGFMVSPYLTTGMDLVGLAAGISRAQSVKSFKFVTRFPSLWNDAIKVSLTSIDVVNGALFRGAPVRIATPLDLKTR
jgi:hypothetical protein